MKLMMEATGDAQVHKTEFHEAMAKWLRQQPTPSKAETLVEMQRQLATMSLKMQAEGLTASA